MKEQSKKRTAERSTSSQAPQPQAMSLQDAYGNASLQAWLKEDLETQTGGEENPTHWMLDGRQRPFSPRERDEGGELRTSAGSVDYQPNLVRGGRWGDTFAADRVNEGGFQDPGQFTGGGGGHVSEETDAGTDGLAGIGFLMAALQSAAHGEVPISVIAGAGTTTEIALAGGAVAGAAVGGWLAGRAIDKAVASHNGGRSLSDSISDWMVNDPDKAKTPRPDEDVGGEYVPIPLGRERAPLASQGRAGGAGDGRGVQESAGGSTMFAGKSIGSKDGTAVGKRRERRGGKVSYEQMLEANFYTDPKRG